MLRLTDKQRNDLVALDDAIKSASPEHVVNWLLHSCAQHLSAAQMEELGNRVGRQGHLKGHYDKGWHLPVEYWTSTEIAEETRRRIAEDVVSGDGGII